MSAFLVTGATRGVGRAAAEQLLEEGHRVVGLYRRSDAAASSMQATHARFSAVRCDLDDEAEVRRALADPKTIGSVAFDGAVFCAGIVTRAPFESASVDGVDPLQAQIHADLYAPLRLGRALLAAGQFLEAASLVFIGSNLARRGLPNTVAYCAAKAGIEGAVRALAAELGPRGIRVNAIAPGLLRTDMTAEFGEEDFAAYAKQVPLRRVGTPQDVAPLVSFLLGSASAYVTGQIIDVDGGWSGARPAL